MDITTLQDLRDAAVVALQAHDKLLEVWRHVQESQLAQEASPDDVALLQDLIVRRIYPVNAFGLLVRINKDAAINILLSRYLGNRVDPDNKFGGFEFELETMLDDLREVGGTEMIVQLVRNPEFAIKRVEDRRVLRTFSTVLQMEQDQIPGWFLSQRCAIE